MHVVRVTCFGKDTAVSYGIPRYRMGYRCDDCNSFARCAGDVLASEGVPRYRAGYRCDVDYCSFFPIVRATCLLRDTTESHGMGYR